MCLRERGVSDVLGEAHRKAVRLLFSLKPSADARAAQRVSGAAKEGLWKRGDFSWLVRTRLRPELKTELGKITEHIGINVRGLEPNRLDCNIVVFRLKQSAAN